LQTEFNIGNGRKLIGSVPSSEYQSLAPRPFNSCLAQSQWEQIKIEIPSWQEALNDFLEGSNEKYQ
jgi:dTDP-4-dehydrorhamnose reductase